MIFLATHSTALGIIIAPVWIEIVILVVLLFFILILWRLSPGSRRNRVFRKTEGLLDQGEINHAFELLLPFRHVRLSRRSDQRFRKLLSRAHTLEGERLLQGGEFERALEEFTSAEDLISSSNDTRQRTINAMLSSIRSKVGKSGAEELKTSEDLITRLLIIDENCQEAKFLLALCFLRKGEKQLAADQLERIVNSEENPNQEKGIDPYLYLSALLLEQNRAKDALRYLSEANRIDSNCPFVGCYLGIAMLESNGDINIAMRVLQKSLGPKGFPAWSTNPSMIWVEGFPQERSYVRNLASQYTYDCPLWGKDYKKAQLAGKQALAEAHLRLGQYNDAARAFQQVAQQSAPSLNVLRGLGLSLVKLEEYDQAFKYLHTAYEIENPKEFRTAANLALCAAKGKPATPEDKRTNVEWAIWLVRDFQPTGDVEFANTLNLLFAEARQYDIPVNSKDQQFLCQQLASVHAVDPLAAQAYHRLFQEYPEAFQLPYGCLYGKAILENELNEPADLPLLKHLFQSDNFARDFFRTQGWPFDDLEVEFLRKFSLQHPGQFPTTSVNDYPKEAEKLLIDRASAAQQASDFVSASEYLQILVRLDPNNYPAQQKLAELAYQNKDYHIACASLEKCQALQPTAPEAYFQAACCQFQLGQFDHFERQLAHCLELAKGEKFTQFALAGARLHLQRYFADQKSHGDSLESVKVLAQRCLRESSKDATAHWLQAAVICQQQQWQELANVELPNVIEESSSKRALQFMQAIRAIARNENDDIAQYVTETETGEREYLLGWQALQNKNPSKAMTHLLKASQSATVSVELARVLAGGIAFHEHHFEQCIDLWKQLPPDFLEGRHLADCLPTVTFLAGLQQIEQQQFQSAVESIRESGRMGRRDSRIGPLLMYSLVKSAQQIIYGKSNHETNGLA